MIHYLVPTKFRGHSVDNFLATWGKALQGRLCPIPYRVFFRADMLKPGAMIFTHFEGLSLPELELIRSFHARQAKAGASFLLLNDPARTLDRYQLGMRLFEENINNFRPRYLDEDLSSIRFPAFVRLANEHGFWDSRLVDDETGLHRTLEILRSKAPDLGSRDAIVVEFCDTSNEGLFRKYSALRIGDEIIPRHVLFSSRWLTKYPDIIDAEKVAEELEFVRKFEHDALLRPVFDLAGVDYGRIDYSFQDGALRVWEINTNPVIVPPPDEIHPDRMKSQTESAERIVAAFERLEQRTPDGNDVKLWRWLDGRLRRKARAAGKRHIRERDRVIDGLTEKSDSSESRF